MSIKNNNVVKNLITNIMVQIVLVLSGFILPKFILDVYGSAVNGMINSINQFLTYAALVEMGVGNAAIVALYRPLAENNIADCNVVLATAKKKYIYSGVLYTVLVCGLSLLYPFAIKNQLDYSFVFSITIILAISGMIDYYIIGKYKVILIADRRYYILNLVKTMATVIMTTGSVILLLHNAPLQIVKGLAVLTHILEALVIKFYVYKQYNQLNFNEKNTIFLDQQNPALIHQICATIVYNTDLIVLTLFLERDSLKEISVYTVYAMALSMVKNLVGVLTTGINANFGNLFAKNKGEEVCDAFKLYELFYLLILFITYSLFISLILPFVKCYTRGITDVDYVRSLVGVLFGVVGLLSQLKDASGVVVNGAGRYKQTQKYAIEEAGVNVVISLLLVRHWGIVGVLIGTMISHIIMDFGIIMYAARELLLGSKMWTWKRIIRNICIMIVVCVASENLQPSINNWTEWINMAILYGLSYTVIIGGINLLCERKYVKELFMKHKLILGRK